MNKDTNNKGSKGGKGKPSNGNRRKGSKPSNKPNANNLQDRFADREEEKGFKKGEKFAAKVITDNSNKPEWHYNDERVLKDVASFSYATPLGSDLHYPRWITTNSGNMFMGSAASIPGLMTIVTALTPGISLDASSPLNIAAQNVYSFVRYKNSGASNYDAPDLMLYLFAMDSLYACWHWMRRIYGEASMYSQVNKYKPRAYLKAEGVDLDDIYAHLADFRAYLNLRAGNIRAFAVPATMTINLWHSWLYANIFKDSSTTKAQEYMYTPAYFYTYDETSSSKGGILTTKPVLFNTKPESRTLLKFADLRNLLDGLINNLQYSEDIGIMSGDIIKAYGEGGLFTLDSVDADYKVESVYDQRVLSQFENTRIAGYFNTAAALPTFNVTQDPNTNTLLFQPNIALAGTLERKGNFINFHWDSPTPQDVIDASRNMFTVRNTSSKTLLNSCGTTLGLQIEIYCYGTSNDPSVGYVEGPLTLYGYSMGQTINFNDPNNVKLAPTNCFLIWAWTAFDWAPPVRIGAVTDVEIFPPTLRDWDIFTILTESNIEALNAVALFSEFNVPN